MWPLMVAMHFGDRYPQLPPPGSLLAFTSITSNGPEIHVMLADGNGRAHVRSGLQAAWSPDARRIAYATVDEASSDIVVMDVDGTDAQRITNDAAPDIQPSWSPDGTRIAFVSTRDGNSDIYIADVSDRSVNRVTTHTAADIEPAWSSDGRRIAFSSTRGGGSNIYVMSPDGRDVVRLTDSGLDHSPAWSSDGSSIAFSSAREGPSEIYVMSSDGTEERRVTDIDGADDPTWSPDNGRIAFSRGVEIHVVDLASHTTVRLTSDTQDTDPAWQPRPASALDEQPSVGVGSASASTPDAQRASAVGQPSGRASQGVDAEPDDANTTSSGDLIAQGAGDERSTREERQTADGDERSSIAASLVKPSDVPLDAEALATSAVGAAILLLLVFPGNLLSNTFEEHYDEIVGWFGRGRRKPRSAPSSARRWIWIGVMGLGTAGLSGLLDPTFGFNRASLVLILSAVVLFAILTLVRGAQTMYIRRTGNTAQVVAFPGSVLIAALTVGASRLVAFQPGYLYGNLTGTSASDLSVQRKGRSQAFLLAMTLAVSFYAWGLWTVVSDDAAARNASLTVLVADAVLAACFVGGVGSVLFALLPIRWLEGYDIVRASRWMWAALAVPTAFVFVHLLLQPGEGAGDSVILPVVLFTVFGAISVGFWAYFRWRKPRTSPEPEPASTLVGSALDAP